MNPLRPPLVLVCFLLVLPSAMRAGDEDEKPPDVPALIEQLKKKEDFGRRTALAALGRAGKDAKSAIPIITDHLKDQNPLVRIEAAKALRKIDPDTRLALPVLLDALRFKDLTVRCFASTAFQGYDPAAVPGLIDLFRDKDRSVHMWAGGAIVLIGKKAEPYLLKARDDPDPRVREQVAETLKMLKMFADSGIGEEGLRSGPQPGQRMPGPILALHINGPFRGQVQQPICDLVAKARPCVLIFARTADNPVLPLVKKLDAQTVYSKEVCSIIFLSDEEGMVDRLKALVEKEKIRELVLSVNYKQTDKGRFSSMAPSNWEISDEAEVTAVLFDKNREVVATFCFRKGELDGKAISRIVQEAANLRQGDKK